MSNTNALEVQDLVKTYGSTRALRNAQLEVRSGEVMALVGGNGSGKSTLVKSLAGITRPDSGKLFLGKEQYDLRHFSPSDSQNAGLVMVHQHRSIFPDMTVTENLSIGRGFLTAGGRIHWAKARERAQHIIDKYGLKCRPQDRAGSLSPASQTMLEIARALQDRDNEFGGVLVLDEPTASLPQHEVDFLLDSLKRFSKEGQAVLFITHHLDEVLAIADRVTGLRDGKTVGTIPASELDRQKLIELIAGKAVKLTNTQPYQNELDEAHRLSAVNLGGGNLKEATFHLRPGEIVGVAGLAGSGRSTLLRMLFGDQPAEHGSVVLDGEEFIPSNPAHSMRKGIAYVPEDRPADAVFPELTVAENLSAGHMRRFRKWGIIDKSAQRRVGREAIDEFNVKTLSERTPITQLSGGNQQKISIARWLLEEPPRLLLLDEPSQGVDVGARSEIWDIVRKVATRGTTVLLVSSNTEELLYLSQRILIMRDGVLGESVQSEGHTAETLNQQIHHMETQK